MIKSGDAPKVMPATEKKQLLATDVEIERNVVEGKGGVNARVVAQNRQNQQNYQNN
jgi:hypothetical protein